MRERERSNKRYGVLLIESGLLSPAEIYLSIRQQIEGIVWSLFDWQDGKVTFSIGDFREADTVASSSPCGRSSSKGSARPATPRPWLPGWGGRNAAGALFRARS